MRRLAGGLLLVLVLSSALAAGAGMYRGAHGGQAVLVRPIDDTPAGPQDTDIYSKDGRAIVYISQVETDRILYSWSGTVLGYLTEDNIYAFGGKHIGWFAGNCVYDHNGNIHGCTADKLPDKPAPAASKAMKALTPIKGSPGDAPAKPAFSAGWAEPPADIFLEQAGK
jgi:hypothetical protein